MPKQQQSKYTPPRLEPYSKEHLAKKMGFDTFDQYQSDLKQKRAKLRYAQLKKEPESAGTDVSEREQSSMSSATPSLKSSSESTDEDSEQKYTPKKLKPLSKEQLAQKMGFTTFNEYQSYLKGQRTKFRYAQLIRPENESSSEQFTSIGIQEIDEFEIPPLPPLYDTTKQEQVDSFIGSLDTTAETKLFAASFEHTRNSIKPDLKKKNYVTDTNQISNGNSR